MITRRSFLGACGVGMAGAAVAGVLAVAKLPELKPAAPKPAVLNTAAMSWTQSVPLRAGDIIDFNGSRFVCHDDGHCCRDGDYSIHFTGQLVPE